MDEKLKKLLKERFAGVVEAAKEVFGDNLESVVLFGSASRPEDARPYGDVNIAIILKRGRPRMDEKFHFYSIMERFIVPFFMSIEDLEKLLASGDLYAFRLTKDSFVLYDDEGRVSKLLSKEYSFEKAWVQLRRLAVASLGIALQNYWRGAYGEAVESAYKSLKAALQLFEVSRSSERSSPATLDREILRNYDPKDVEARVFNSLRLARITGLNRDDCRRILDETLRLVYSVLGVESRRFEEIEEKVRSKGIVPSIVKAWEEEGKIRWGIYYTDGEGRISGFEL